MNAKDKMINKENIRFMEIRLKKEKEIFGQPNLLYNLIQSNNLILNFIQHLYKDIQFLFFKSHRRSLLTNRRLVGCSMTIVSL